MNEEQILSELEANKRDHKVEITDVAISKVPYIEYKEIPEDCYKTLQELARMVLILSKENNNCDYLQFRCSRACYRWTRVYDGILW